MNYLLCYIFSDGFCLREEKISGKEVVAMGRGEKEREKNF